MLSYTIRRLLYIIPILLGVIFIVTLTLDLIPGDPAALILGEFATAEAVANLRTNLGLDQPLLVRYGNYIVDVVQGDLGKIGRASCRARGQARGWVTTLVR